MVSAFLQRQHRKQLQAYALLLDGRFGVMVTKGSIYFTQQKKAVPVESSENDKAELRPDIHRVEEIIAG